MSKSKMFLILNLALALSAASSFANEGKGTGGTNGNTQAIPFEEFRARCANPNSFREQHAPEQIILQCTDVSHDWTQDAPGEVPLTGSRQVMTAIYSDKWHVATTEANIQLAQQKGGSCPRFKEVEREITIERSLSCADIMNVKGSIEDFCASSLDGAKAGNPKLISVRDTGNTMDLCRGGRASK